MKTPSLIDCKRELTLLTALIHQFWAGGDRCEGFDQYVKEVFQTGLLKGRLWLDQYVTFEIGSIINHDVVSQPLKKRYADFDNSDCFFPTNYDALCIFDGWVSSMAHKVYDSQVGYCRWNYTNEADTLTAAMCKKYRLDVMVPKDLTNDEQQQLIDAYQGFSAEEAGSFSTAEKLSPREIHFWNDEQSLNFTRTLTSAIFSHGLFCAKYNNTTRITQALLPVYKTFMEMPFSVTNGDDIMKQALTNEFIVLFNALEPPQFYSQTEYYIARTKHQEYLDLSEQARAALKEANIAASKKMIDEILSESSVEEDRRKDNIFADNVNALVNTIAIQEV